MKSFVFSLLVITTILLPQQSRANPEKALRQRVERFYSLFSSSQQNGMWEILSARFRREQDNNKKKYVSGLPKPGAYHSEACITEIQIKGKQARVRLRIRIIASSADEIGWEDHEDTWVVERGRWHFDGSKTTDYEKTEIP